MQLPAKFRDARTQIKHRRIERQAHRQLTEELAAFTTADDRLELETILDRHTPAETREIRAILTRQDARRRYAA